MVLNDGCKVIEIEDEIEIDKEIIKDTFEKMIYPPLFWMPAHSHLTKITGLVRCVLPVSEEVLYGIPPHGLGETGSNNRTRKGW